MAQPNNDVIEIQIIGDVQGQMCRNVLFYEKVQAQFPASEIAQSAATQFITEMLPLLSDRYVLREVQWRNLFNPSDAGSIDLIDQPGGIISAAMPAHDTYSIRLLHSEPTIRSGRKSISGVTEDANVEGVLSGTALPAVQDASFDWLVPGLKDVATGLVDIALPIVVKRIIDQTGLQTKYRLPNSAVEAVIGYVYQAVLSAYVRTQNSRKIGYGE